MLTPEDWHKRFQTQARWTEQIRRYLYQQTGLGFAKRVLEVGCGTGVIARDIQQQFMPEEPRIVGLDMRMRSLKFAHENDGIPLFTCGDAHHLPYADQTMDVTLCHFLLLWLKSPEIGVREMQRVTRKGGYVLALAEPDYGGRMDYPPSLVKLGKLQTKSLKRQGAEPEIGRRLASIFHKSGLTNVQSGLLGGQWTQGRPSWEWESEWAMLEDDLGGAVSDQWLRKMIRLDYEAWQAGERVLFVPTFYAVGQVA